MAHFILTDQDDTIFGTSGDDVFSGISIGTDFLYGLDGNDIFELTEIISATGVIDGGAGTDTVFSSYLGDYEYINIELLKLGNSSDLYINTDQISSFQYIEALQPNILVYLSGPGRSVDLSSKFLGTVGLSFDANAVNGSLEIVLSPYDDRLYGMSSATIARGGDGNDIIEGSPEDDQIYGDGGNDFISAGYGSDVVHGGDGDDEIVGGEGDDYLYGDEGNDKIYGYNNDDFLAGGDGDDILNGGGGIDVITGGSGDDHIILYSTEGSVDGGTGYDTAFAQWHTLGLLVLENIEELQITQNISATIQQLSFFTIFRSAYDDLTSPLVFELTGDGGTFDISQRVEDSQRTFIDAHNLAGLAIITSGNESDVILGSVFDDLIIGGAGGDEIYGGAGNDTASYASAAARVHVNMATGKGSLGDAAGDLLSSIENLNGSAFNDILEGDEGNNRL
ncbi:calcium-binding protein, partial [Tistrella mobilis]